MSVTIPTVVTGDDISLPVTLKKNGVVFDIPVSTPVVAMLVTRDRKEALTDEVSQVNTTTGADWANSLVVVELSSAKTVDIQEQGRALLEIQVNDGGKLTWFVSVEIAKGNIA